MILRRVIDHFRKQEWIAILYSRDSLLFS